MFAVLLSNSPWEKLIEKADAIIKAASSSPLAIVALVVLTLAAVVIILFQSAPTKVRVAMYLVMVLSFFGFVLVGLRAQPPEPEKQVTYAGRVFDALTGDPIPRAEISVQIEGTTCSDVSDGDGNYHAKCRRSKTHLGWSTLRPGAKL